MIPNIQTLRSGLSQLPLYGPAVDAILKHLGVRRRWRKRFNISRFQRDIRRGGAFTAKQVFEVFLGLEQLGFGVLEQDHGEAFIVWGPLAAKPEEPAPPLTEEAITLAFPLRREMVLTFQLPIDITEQEASRLCGFIRACALPITEESK